MSRSVKLSEVNEAAEECITQLVREKMHTCAITVLTLSELDGMTMEGLFDNHVNGMIFLEELSLEV